MLETNVIHCMDNVEGLRTRIPDNSIDLTVTSPPYDDLRDYNEYEWDFKSLAKQLYRVIKDGGIIVWVVGDKTVNGSETGSSFKQALYFKEIGFNLHDTMIYQKDSLTFPDFNRYYQVFEFMFVFSKRKPKTTNLIRDRNNKKKGCSLKGVTERNKNGSLTESNGSRKGRKIKSKSIRFNVWKYGVGNNKTTKDKFAYNHPAMFPEQLAKDHILSWSNEGDIVLDPFMGSGTTAKMSELLNRKWIGFEISQEYVNIAYKRVGKFDKSYYDELPKEEKPKQTQLF